MKHFPDPISVEIETISPFGQGVAKLPLPSGAKALLEVPYTMPGDVASVAVLSKKNSVYRAHLLDILKPSEKRVEAICPHFGECGGCGWQHIPYEEQLIVKQRLLERLFKRELNCDFSIQAIVPCASPFNYRNKMEFTFDNGALGLVKGHGSQEIIPIRECHLGSSWISSVLKLFNNLSCGSSPYPIRVIFREGQKQRMVIVLGARISKELLSSLKVLEDGESLLSVYEGEKSLYGPPDLEEVLSVCGREFRFVVSPLSFFQPNTRQAEILFSLAIELADLQGTEVVYDLYCGVGTIGICMSPFVKQVIGIEIFKEAVVSARKNALLNGISDYRAFAAPVGQLRDRLPKPDVIVIDPPRAGIEPHALKFIIDANPKKILYISCHPTTQVRDLLIFMERGYTIERIQPVDQFPQTVHIETIVLLSR